MGALGDYVHLSRLGYKGDLNSRRTPFITTYSDALKKKKAQIEKWMAQEKNTDVLKAYKNELDKNLAIIKTIDENAVDGKSLSEYANVEQQYIDAGLQGLVRNLGIEFIKQDRIAGIFAKNGGSLTRGGAAASVNYGSPNSKRKTVVQYQNINRLNDRIRSAIIKAIGDAVQNLNNINNISPQEYLKISENNLKKLAFNADTIINSKTKTSSSVVSTKSGGTSVAEIEQEIYKYVSYVKKDLMAKDPEVAKKFAADITTLATFLTLSDNLAAFQGDIGEKLVEVTATKMESIAGHAISESMQIGGNDSYRGLLGSNFIKSYYYDESEMLKQISNNNKGHIEITQNGPFLTSMDTKQKELVDVKITFKDNTQPILASVKNWNLKEDSNTHREVKGNFLNYMQSENDGNFMNHFLNLNAAGSQRGRSEFAKERAEINVVIKQLMAMKLLFGYNTDISTGKLTEANTFVVINNAEYESYVISAPDMIKKVMQKKIHTKSIIDTDAILESNKWQPYITTRLINVIKSLNYISIIRLTQNDLNDASVKVD